MTKQAYESMAWWEAKTQEIEGKLHSITEENQAL